MTSYPTSTEPRVLENVQRLFGPLLSEGCKIVAAYPYGADHYVLRFENGKGKEHRHMSRDDAGWVPLQPHYPRGTPLYNLDSLHRFPDAPVLVVEGEKCVQALKDFEPEIVAVTSMNGSSGCNKADWTPLHGRRVLIWPDNDEPGQDYAWDVHSKVAGSRVIDVPGLDLEPKDDVVEWLESNRQVTAADILELPSLPERPWADPSPIPDDEEPTPELPLAAVPQIIRQHAADVAERIGAPLEWAVFGDIFFIGATAGTSHRLQPKKYDDSWKVVPNFWCVVVGRPGMKKSPLLTEILQPLRIADKKLQDENHKNELEYQTRKREYEQRQRHQEREYQKKLANQPSPGLVSEPPPPPPKSKRLLVTDVTTEKLAEIAVANPNGVAAVFDELSSLLGSFDKKGREGDRSFYLTAWNGDSSYNIDRIGRGTLHIERLCLSLFAGTQPGKIAPYIRQAQNQGRDDDGFVQRFNFVYLDEEAPCLPYIDRAPDEEAKQRLWQRLSSIRDEVPRDYRFDPSAQDRYEQWVRNNADIIASQPDDALRSLRAKLERTLIQISLILHLCESFEERVSEATLAAAIELTEYLWKHAQKLYGSTSRDPVAACARHILRKVAGASIRQISTRDLKQRRWKHFEHTDQALELLKESGWTRIENHQDKKGGRSSQVILFYPRLFETDPPKPPKPSDQHSFVGFGGSLSNKQPPTCQQGCEPRPHAENTNGFGWRAVQ